MDNYDEKMAMAEPMNHRMDTSRYGTDQTLGQSMPTQKQKLDILLVRVREQINVCSVQTEHVCDLHTRMFGYVKDDAKVGRDGPTEVAPASGMLDSLAFALDELSSRQAYLFRLIKALEEI